MVSGPWELKSVYENEVPKIVNQLEWIYPKWYRTDYYGNENLKKEKKIGIVGEDFIKIIYGVFSI